MRFIQRPSLFSLAVFSCLSPMLICLLFDQEFWPFTHFPMYSRLSNPSVWAQVRVYNSNTNKESVLKDEDCFKPYGHVRVNYSILNFFLENQHKKIDLLLNAVAHQIQQHSIPICQFPKGSYLKAYFLTFDTSQVLDLNKPFSAQEKPISKEVPLAP